MSDRKLISITYRFSTMANRMVTFLTQSSKCVTLIFDLGGHFELTKSPNRLFCNW